MSLPDRLALDTNCFIYLFEGDPARTSYLAEEVFHPAARGGRQLTASTLAVAELLAGPYRAGRASAAMALRTAVEQLPGLDLIPLAADLAAAAAALRGRHRVSLADAVHLATAGAHAEALLTNDARLATVAGEVPVLLLDDLVDSR